MDKAARTTTGRKTGRKAPRGAYASLTRRPRTQAATAISAIKEYILTEGLRPGDPLPTESQLCTDLEVSRSSVREAVRTLVALDIVEVRHGHGTFVSDASMRPMVESLVFRGLLHSGEGYRGLRDVVEVRATLDRALAPRVVEAWTDREDPDLDAIVDEMEALALKGSLFTEPDQAFHTRLLDALPNHLFQYLTEAFWTVHALTVPLLGAPTPDDIITTARAHRTMLAAARAGDVEAYQQATTEHYAPLLAALS
ncbi:MAG: FCD domain-containing protein [Actinomyces bowdenii]|nr:FCD domain-containing protein [Actinomyces bowdenii]